MGIQLPRGDGLLRSSRALPAAIFSFVFPPTCLSCRSVLPPDAIVLCEPCVRLLRPVDRDDPVYHATLHALQAGGVIDGLAVPYYFEQGGPLQQVIHQLKYGGMTVGGSFLGSTIARVLAGEGAECSSAMVLPVPLHRVKLRERGYNQAEVIARRIARETGATLCPSVLRRVIHTTSQTTLDRAERAHNVTGAFAVRRSRAGNVNGRAVLLVDDVVTTGATVRSCAGVLRRAGAREITVCAAALAP